MAEAVDITFHVGELFQSYSSFQSKLKAYEENHYVQFTHKDSRTLINAEKRIPKRVEGANSDLRYYKITLACVFGGKEYKCKQNGLRANQSTIKQHCSAGMTLMLTEDKKSLEIKVINEDHNHIVSKSVYAHLPRQRRLSEGETQDVQKLLKLKVNKKLLQQHINDATGKVVTLKDITNLQTKAKHLSKGNIITTVNHLKDIEGASVEVHVDDENEFCGLFFQDSTMKMTFAAYPELIMVDATYKLNEFRMPLYVILIIDGNGQSEIVGLYLTSHETRESIKKMVICFKAVNPAWKNTRVIFTDKDFVERAVFKDEFPQATLLLCLFHTLRSFRREVTCEKMSINSGERIHILELLQNLSYSFSEAQYNERYEELLHCGHKSVVKYYNENWHPIRLQWVQCYKGANFTMGERTTNRLECINSKLKSVCSRYANLKVFFDEFFLLLSCLRNERDHVTLMTFVKRRVTKHSTEFPEETYAQFLTPYAYSFVSKQFSLMQTVKLPEIQGGENTLVLSSSLGSITVSVISCECAFWTSMKLPCRHILKFRQVKSLPLFCVDCIDSRWQLSHLKSTFENKEQLHLDSSFEVSSVQAASTKSKLSQHQKFRKLMSLCQEICSLGSEVGMQQFEERYSILKQVRDDWKLGKMIEKDLGDDDRDCDVEKEFALACKNKVNKSFLPHEEDMIIKTTFNGDESTSTHVKEHHISPNNQEAVILDHADIMMTENTGELSLEKIKSPPKIKKRGRPKGHETTVVGLPKKKLKLKDKPIPFLKKNFKERDKVILLWFCDATTVNAALSDNKLIEEEEVETRPERVPMACIDENVCLRSVRKYFTHDGWAVLDTTVQAVKNNPVWYCGVCKIPISDETESSVICDSCLIWHHFKCTSLQNSPKSKFWFCRLCHN